ncbi:MAG TPA: BTAD domain-containing putative transcriptional regulator [Gaiellaceae bacterium]|nr:BTAD domain-containing putative transcriptional regulator [Gaiellaceae bacterium]
MRQRALLSIFLLHANEVLSRDRLIDQLWGEEPPETAASALRVHIAQLRKLLADGEGSDSSLVTHSPGYVLRLEPDQLDLSRFERLVEQGSRALGESRWVEASNALNEALALWRGPALADVSYERFAHEAILRLDGLRLAAVEKRIEADLALGKHAELIGELEALVAEHGLHERFHGQLMLGLYRSGRQADALKAYRVARGRLVEELGIDPSPALQRLEREILLQDPSLELARPEEPPLDVLETEGTRPVSVLVADIGWAALGDAQDGEMPEEALGVVIDAVLGQGGRIDAFATQDLVALFGSPAASEDDAERALLAALAIRDGAQALGFEARIGVGTGDARHSVLHLAERLTKQARPSQILVSASTHRLTRLSFEFAPARTAAGHVRGTVASYEVGRRLARPQKARGIEGLRADMRGRDGELAELRAALADALAGQGQMVVIGGEAGVGKSRLVAELRAHALAEDRSSVLRWLEGRCRASGSSTSYLPYVELLAEYFGWVPEDDDREREKGIVSSALELVRRGHLPEERVGDLVPLLANLLSIRPVGDGFDPFANTPPEHVRNLTFAALRDFVLALARERPLALVLEDFHWADALSVDLTTHLMDLLASTQVLLICVLRPEPLHRWERLTAISAQKCGDAYHQLELEELSPEQMLELFQALLPIDDLSPRVREMILTAAQGNPFFLEEILLSLIDSGALYRERRRWRAQREIESLTIPESIETVILSRADRLEPDVHSVLQTAAVIGRSFRRRVLVQLAEQGTDVEHALWELEKRALVFEDRVIPEEEFSFKHVLTQEAIYRSIPQGRSTALHERTADIIEDLYQDGLEEQYEQLAFHFDRSGNARKAVDYLVKAAEKSSRLFLNAEAIVYFERALRRLEDAVGTGQVPRKRARDLQASIHESLGDIRRLVGSHDEAIGSYERARALVAERDALGTARIHRKLASTYHLQRRIEHAHAELDRARAALENAGSTGSDAWWEELVEIELKRIWLHYFFGAAHLIEGLEPTRTLVETHGTAIQQGRIFNLLAAAGVRRDRMFASHETVGHARSALAAAEESGDLGEIAQGHQVLGFSLLLALQFEEGEAELRQALSLAERAGDVTLQSRTLPYLTLACRRRGAVDEVRTLALRTLAVAEAGQMNEYIAQAKANQAWVAWREGDISAAEHHASAAWSMWQEIPGSLYRVLDWIVVWPLVGIALERGRLPEALEYVRDLVEPTRQPLPEDLRVALDSALLAWEREDLHAARAALDSACAHAEQYGYL